MPAPFGLTPAGFSPMSLGEIRDSINAKIWGAFGPTLDLSDRSYEGQLVGILAERIASLWELLEVVVGMFDRAKAEGSLLAALSSLTGTIKAAARASTVTLTATGADGTVITAGSVARVPAGVRFATDALATLVQLAAWTGSTAYAVGARRTNAGRCYVCITAGTSASSGGPTTTAADITDGTAHWRYIGEGVAAADVAAAATEVGPLAANSGTVTEIVTPVGGWSGVRNLADAVAGALQETDEQLRIRGVIELASAGTGPPDAILAAVAKVAQVTAVTVFNNTSDLVDADGQPPHTVEVLVSGGDDQVIRETLFRSCVVAGIATHGNVTGTVTDSQGTAQTIRFSRPVGVPIYVAISIIKDPSVYPADGDAQVIAAIVNWGATTARNGKNAVSSAIGAQAFTVPGVLEVVTCFIGTAPSPTSAATISISTRQRAEIDSSRVAVTATNGTP